MGKKFRDVLTNSFHYVNASGGYGDIKFHFNTSKGPCFRKSNNGFKYCYVITADESNICDFVVIKSEVYDSQAYIFIQEDFEELLYDKENDAVYGGRLNGHFFKKIGSDDFFQKLVNLFENHKRPMTQTEVRQKKEKEKRQDDMFNSLVDLYEKHKKTQNKEQGDTMAAKKLDTKNILDTLKESAAHGAKVAVASTAHHEVVDKAAKKVIGDMLPQLNELPSGVRELIYAAIMFTVANVFEHKYAPLAQQFSLLVVEARVRDIVESFAKGRLPQIQSAFSLFGNLDD